MNSVAFLPNSLLKIKEQLNIPVSTTTNRNKSRNYSYPAENGQVFKQLVSQNIAIKQNQMDILVSFISKFINESKDLDGDIVDMVNKNFWDLI